MFHDVSSVFVVIIGILLLSRMKLRMVPPIVDVFDKYSYHVFLVHYFFIIGPFSMAHLTQYVFVNILSVIVVTILVTYLFVKLNVLANRLVFDKALIIK